MPSKHAVFSPSGAHRWMKCPGSIVLSEGAPYRDSEYAKEGTLAHDHASKFLTTGSYGTGIDREMARHVRDYTTYVLAESNGHDLLVEQELDLEWLTGEKGAVGTSDSVIISADGDLLTVVDLKYGMGVRVYVHKNEQLMMYALAAYKQFGMMGDFQRVKMVIHQPRLDHVDEWEIPIKELLEFAGDIKFAVQEVNKAKKSNSLDGFLNPGEKQCKFCPGAGKCSALANMVANETHADFDNLEQTELTAPIELGNALAKISLIEIWCKGVRATATATLLAGEPVKGWKLIEGKKGNRKWADEDAVEKEMREAGLKDDEMFRSDLVTPAVAEKTLKKKKPDVWEKLKPLYKQPPGKPAVAPITDPAPAYQPSSAEDYEEVE